MKIFLVTLPVILLVFLNYVQSGSSSRRGSSIPDLNYRAEHPEDEYRIIRNPDNTRMGIQYGEDFAERILNPDGTLRGYNFRGKFIKKVEFGDGAELFDWDNIKVGTYQGRHFYNKPQGAPGRRIVPVKNGYHLRVGGKRIATFETVWSYDNDYPTGSSGAGSSRGPIGKK